MDGYAFSSNQANLEQPLKLVVVALAGHPFEGDVRAGECGRIMTGAVVPTSTDTVVMQEQVVVKGNEILLQRIPSAGENIRRAGEEVRPGRVLYVETSYGNPEGVLAANNLVALLIHGAMCHHSQACWFDQPHEPAW